MITASGRRLQAGQLVMLLLQRVAEPRQDLAFEPAVRDRLLELPGDDLTHRQPGAIRLAQRTGAAEDHDPVFLGRRWFKRGRQRRKSVHPAAPGRRTELEDHQRDQAHQADREPAEDRRTYATRSPRPRRQPHCQRRSDHGGQDQRRCTRTAPPAMRPRSSLDEPLAAARESSRGARSLPAPGWRSARPLPGDAAP